MSITMNSKSGFRIRGAEVSLSFDSIKAASRGTTQRKLSIAVPRMSRKHDLWSWQSKGTPKGPHPPKK